MLKIGDCVVLQINNPDDNYVLLKGSKGIILDITLQYGERKILVRWDYKSSQAESNNHLIEDYYENALDQNGDFTNVYHEQSEHLWWVSESEINLIEFRAKRKKETSQEYRICRKIHELDTRWKERHA